VLCSSLARDRVAHAYLFTGPDSVGKSTAARIFAQALNCAGGADARPCGECRQCRLAEEGNHPDIRVFTGGERGHKSVIPIEVIRQQFVYDVHLKPVLGRRKVYVLDPADRTAHLAIHTVLKTLEEPPPYVVAILVTAHPEVLPPTIPSRCQRVVFQLVGTDAIRDELVRLGLETEAAASLARLSGGRIAWAIGAVRRPQVLDARRALLDLCSHIDARAVPASVRIAEEIKLQAAQLARADSEPEQEGEEAEQTPKAPSGDRAVRQELPWCLDIMVSWYRDLLAIGENGPLLNPDYEKALRERFRPQLVLQAQCAVESILETKHAIQRNANIDVALESLVIGLVGAFD